MAPKDPPAEAFSPDMLLVDKPSGITSFDVIRLLRKKLGVWKMGHAGTLDPLASGLMIIGVDNGTKKLAEILFGLRTDSGDVTGKTLEEVAVPADFLAAAVFEKKVADALAKMVGTLELPVPIYSAIKRQGKKLYELARAGATAEEIKPPIKAMQISAARVLGPVQIEKTAPDQTGQTGQKIWLRVHFAVSSGTYIRALAEELGRRLCLPATLRNLRRTKIGQFKIEDATKITT